MNQKPLNKLNLIIWTTETTNPKLTVKWYATRLWRETTNWQPICAEAEETHPDWKYRLSDHQMRRIHKKTWLPKQECIHCWTEIHFLLYCGMFSKLSEIHIKASWLGIFMNKRAVVLYVSIYFCFAALPYSVLFHDYKIKNRCWLVNSQEIKLEFFWWLLDLDVSFEVKKKAKNSSQFQLLRFVDF